ncbi:hypothetical protein SAMN05216413_2347 [Ruminococcaceae bacterium KH2T8]|nr:hypothetical protein SAMN05216413_2347 [Ruminococcaceae bacterium KH2T8]
MAKSQKSDKVNQSIKASKRSKALMSAVVVVLILCILCFFIYITGVIPRLATGTKILKTNADGTTQVIENISVVETNYHYHNLLNQYVQYGYMSSATDLQEVADPTTGKTYYQLILDQAASEIMQIVILNQAAEEAQFTQYSGAARMAQLQLDNLRQTAELQGYPSVDRYLAAMYGAGMTSRAYLQCVERELLAKEFQQYVSQFMMNVTDEEIMASYEQDSSAFDQVDFSYHFFSGEDNGDGTYDKTQALADAQEVIDNAHDADSFKEALIDVMGDEEAEAAGFTEDYDPSYGEGYNLTSAAYMGEEVATFLFTDGDEGDGTVIETDTGAFAIFLHKRYVDDTTTATYRSLTLNNPTNTDYDATPEEVQASFDELVARAQGLAASATDPLSFMKIVKENSESNYDVVYGGYNTGITADAYNIEPAEGEELTAQQNNLIAFGQWLFAEERQPGDTYISQSPDKRSVTIYYFEGFSPAWVSNARQQRNQELAQAWADMKLAEGNPTYAIAYELVRRLSYAV